MKKTQSKSLLIAIAAFAVTTTGVYAYGGENIIERANLSAEQKAALSQARELRENGNLAAARDTLVEAGIDDEVLRKLHRAKHMAQSDVAVALEQNDYTAFQAAIVDTPLADIITTEADFQQFRAAQTLKSSGEYAAAKEILTTLGVSQMPAPHRFHHSRATTAALDELTVEQQAALQVAIQANDKDTTRAIWAEAGIE